MVANIERRHSQIIIIHSGMSGTLSRQNSHEAMLVSAWDADLLALMSHAGNRNSSVPVDDVTAMHPAREK